MITCSHASNDLVVRHLDGYRFEIAVRSHRITVDQPADGGGTDQAPSPTELFIAALTSCVTFYAYRYLARHGLPTEGLSVGASYSLGSRPTRVDSIALELHVPPGVPAERRDALLAVASHCTVHNTLLQPPHVTIQMLEPAEL